MTKTHKRNHYIPRGILNYWAISKESGSGVWVYQIENRKKQFSNANGRKAYKFAIVEDLYVPNIDSNRNIFMESEWLNKLENILVKFVEQLHTKVEQIVLDKPEDVFLIEMALHSMFFRSRYNIDNLINHIETNDDLKNEITNSPKDSNKKIILEMIINQITDAYLKFTPLAIEILYFENGGLIYSDRPYFIIGDKNFLGLSNKVIIAFYKSDHFKYKYANGSEKSKKISNMALALNSRDWIIAENEVLLDEYTQFVESELWMDNVKSDVIIRKEYEKILNGWSFK